MNASKFDTIVENRAVERTRANIMAFQTAIVAAVKTLGGRGLKYHYTDRELLCGTQFAELIEGLKTNTYPDFLWENERKKVADELLGVMDEMQKALIAPKPSEDGPMPPTEKTEGAA